MLKGRLSSVLAPIFKREINQGRNVEREAEFCIGPNIHEGYQVGTKCRKGGWVLYWPQYSRGISSRDEMSKGRLGSVLTRGHSHTG